MTRRWSDLDTDVHRLPSGFTRAGYDSNTRRYHFSDAEGRMYQGEPGEEFGGRLTPINAIDPSIRHRFSPDDDKAEEQDVVDSPPGPSKEDDPQPTPRIVPSFSDFLSSGQMTTAAPPKPPQKKPQNRGPTFSLKRTTASIMGFRSTKSKGKTATLPNLPYSGADEWGVAQSHSAKF